MAKSKKKFEKKFVSRQIAGIQVLETGVCLIYDCIYVRDLDGIETYESFIERGHMVRSRPAYLGDCSEPEQKKLAALRIRPDLAPAAEAIRALMPKLVEAAIELDQFYGIKET